MRQRVRVGARGSALSLAQTEIVARALRELADVDVEVVTFRTTGDRLSQLGTEPLGTTGKDLFTREIDEALLAGTVDLAVHSVKDLPSRLPEGLMLAAVPEREDPSDVLISRDRAGFAELPAGARVGTSSPRRRAQILAARRDLEVLDARGNVDTRLRRLAEGRWDAIVLARAGLARLGRVDEATEVLSHAVMLPAIGQGALAVVAREDDRAAREIAARVDHPTSHGETVAERALLDLLEAGCRAPVAGLARAREARLSLEGAAFAPDGSSSVRATGDGRADEPEALGHDVARRLLARGAAGLIELSRGSPTP